MPKTKNKQLFMDQVLLHVIFFSPINMKDTKFSNTHNTPYHLSLGNRMNAKLQQQWMFHPYACIFIMQSPPYHLYLITDSTSVISVTLMKLRKPLSFEQLGIVHQMQYVTHMAPIKLYTTLLCRRV